MKICVNGVIREMTEEELKEINKVEVIQEEKQNNNLEERLQKLENFLKKLVTDAEYNEIMENLENLEADEI